MNSNSQRGQPTRFVTNARVPDRARSTETPRIGNLISTQEAVNDGPDERGAVTMSLDDLNIEGIIDAASKGRASSPRSAILSAGRGHGLLISIRLQVQLTVTSTSIQRNIEASEPSTTVNRNQATADRFDPLVAITTVLGGRNRDTRVHYGFVRDIVMADRKHEMADLGWSSFEQLVEAASQSGVVEVINTKGEKFLKLPQSPPPTPRIPGSLDVADYPPEHHALVSTMIKLTDGRPWVGKSTTELATELKRSFPRPEGDYFLIAKAKECGILRLHRSGHGVAWAYLNPPPARTGAVSQPSSTPTQSRPSPLVPRQLAPKHVQPHVKKDFAPSKPVHSPPPLQPPRNPIQPKVSQRRVEPTSNESPAIPLPATQRVISILSRLTHGQPGAFVDVDEVMRLLKLEYPWSTDEFLLSVIARAEKENVVVREGEEERSQPGLSATSPPPLNHQLEKNTKPTSPIKPKQKLTQPKPSQHHIPKPTVSRQQVPSGPKKGVESTTGGSTSSKPSKAVPPPPASWYHPAAEHAMLPRSGGGWWH